MVFNRALQSFLVSLLLSSTKAGAANFISLEVRSNVDYYGPLFIGSQYREERVIYDTASSHVMVGHLLTQGLQLASNYEIEESETAH